VVWILQSLRSGHFDTFQPTRVTRHMHRRLSDGYISRRKKSTPSTCL